MRRILVVALVLLLGSEAHAQEKTAEAKVLERWVGTWKTEVVHKAAEWNPKEVKTTGKITCKWVLGDRFVEESGAGSDGVEHRVLWWFDPNRKTYRNAYFNSAGVALDAAGTWDAKATTMTWKSDAGPGMTAVLSHRFLDADNYEWTYLIKDAGGKIYLDMKGKHTRAK